MLFKRPQTAFPNAGIFIPLINYSPTLPQAQKDNLAARKEELHSDLYQYHRKIKLLDSFQNAKSNKTLFTFPSNWELAWEYVDDKVKELIRQDIRSLNNHIPPRPKRNNTSSSEDIRVIRSLQNNPHIIIKRADKGSKIVIMDKQQYALEAKRQLSNINYYKSVQSSLHLTTQNRIRTIIQNLYHRKYITAKQQDFLFGPDNPRERCFYLLPKIHEHLREQMLGLRLM